MTLTPHGAQALGATTRTPWGTSWFVQFAHEHDKKLFCPSCNVRPGQFHQAGCDSEGLSIWDGPKDTPGMLLIELVPDDMRLQYSYCMKCDQPLLFDGHPSTDPDRRHVFVTRHGFGIHVDCVMELSREIMAPMEAITEEFEARRRALLEG